MKLTLFTGVSSLALPVRPPHELDEQLRQFEPPERGPRSEFTSLHSVPLRRTVERDLTNNETVYRIRSDGGDFGGAALAHIDDINLTVGYTIEKTYWIHEYDPSTAMAAIKQVTTHQRDAWSTRLECECVLSNADPEHFRLQATLKAYVSEVVFFEQDWDEVIPRVLL